MFTKRGWFIISIILVFAIGDFFLLLSNNINVGCTFILVQNFFVPFIVAPLLIEHNNFSIQQSFQLEWMIVGGMIGAILTTGMTIATGIDYFFRGGSENLDAYKGITIPRTGQILAVEIFAFVFIWLLLTLLSAFSGLLSSVLFARNLKRKK